MLIQQVFGNLPGSCVRQSSQGRKNKTRGISSGLSFCLFLHDFRKFLSYLFQSPENRRCPSIYIAEAELPLKYISKGEQTNEQKETYGIHDGAGGHGNGGTGKCSCGSRKSWGGGTKVLTEAELDEDDKAETSVPIEYTVGAAFTVKLPTSITLEKGESGYSYSGTVGVKGDIDAGKVVRVTPDPSITMYDVTNRPTEDVPSGEDDQNYAHKTAKAVEGALGKKYWAQTEMSADEFSDAVLTYGADTMQSGIWKGKLGVSISYENDRVELVAGQTYTLGGYSWVAAEVKNNYAVLQSTGVTAGYWPGYTMAQFGNGSFYASYIDGQDISGYDDKTTTLYNSIQSAEYSGADYGTGLYLVSNAMAGTTESGEKGSGNYWTALKTAAVNKSSFGASHSYSWLGTVYSSTGAQAVDSHGGVCNHAYQDVLFVVAPAFNLDTSKVTLEGNALTVK
ncbi:MAG: hypothetical protein ACI4FX_05165 [Agathobacter sp.]